MIGEILTWLGAIAIVTGGLFGLLAGLGVMRLPDLYTRMHAASKAGLVGAGLTYVGIAIVSADSAIILRALLGLAFLALTTPVSAHLLARAALKAGHLPMNTTNVKKSHS